MLDSEVQFCRSIKSSLLIHLFDNNPTLHLQLTSLQRLQQYKVSSRRSGRHARERGCLYQRISYACASLRMEAGTEIIISPVLILRIIL